MTRTVFKTFAVPATGVGRVDYSQDVQKTVEPLTIEWQETYTDYLPFALNAGESATQTITIPSLYELILYDFTLSCYPSSDIRLEVAYFNPFWNIPPVTPPIQDFMAKSGTQAIDAFLEKGQILTDFYLVTATNLGLAPIDCYYTAHGIKTLRSQL